MNATPTEDRVILKLDHSDKTTDAGLILTSREIPNQGEVMAVGPGRANSFGIHIPMPVNVGDIVVFEHAAAYGIELDGEKYVTVPLHGILAIVEK
jgi:chaperonin GroES